MKNQAIGACSAILAWVAISRLVPSRLDSMGDILIPLAVFAVGSIAAVATWRQKRWGYALGLLFCGFQIFAVIWLSTYDFRSTIFGERRWAEMLMLPSAAICLSLLLKSKEPNHTLEATSMSVTDAAAQPPRQPRSRLT
jgi:hypothetical protein